MYTDNDSIMKLPVEVTIHLFESHHCNLALIKVNTFTMLLLLSPLKVRQYARFHLA
jgi:hypothetical protein